MAVRTECGGSFSAAAIRSTASRSCSSSNSRIARSTPMRHPAEEVPLGRFPQWAATKPANTALPLAVPRGTGVPVTGVRYGVSHVRVQSGRGSSFVWASLDSAGRAAGQGAAVTVWSGRPATWQRSPARRL